MNDTARLMNDLEVIVSTLAPETEQDKLYIRLEEVLSNYKIHRKSLKDIENDLLDKIDIYLSARTIEGLSPKTIAGYRIELIQFSKHINKPVVQITTSDIRKYLAHNPKWMMSTVDRKLSVLKAFFGWMVKEEVVLRDPSAKINAPKKPTRLPKSLSIEEIETVRDACEDLRERALVEVLFSTAARLGEVAGLKITDINTQDLSVRLIGKGNKERISYLSIKAMHQLRKYLNSRNDDCDYLFVTERKPIRKMSHRNIERIIDQIGSRVSISQKLTPHKFRHSFATHFLNQGADIADVQAILGHSDASTTLGYYAQVSEERKRNAYRKFHVQ